MSSRKAAECNPSSARQSQAQMINPATSYAAVVATPFIAGASHQHPTSDRHHKHKRSHHSSSNQPQKPDDQAPKQSPAQTSPENDLTTWTNLTLSRSGATLRPVCTCEGAAEGKHGRSCPLLHAESKGSRYAGIPRVDEPGVKLEMAAVRKLEESDARMEKEGKYGRGGSGDGNGEGESEEGWVVVS